MNLFKIVLTARESHNCPCVKVNDQFVFQYPSFVLEESSALPCATCMNAFLPTLIGLSKGQTFSELSVNDTLLLRCPFVGHFVLYEVLLAPAQKSFTQVMSKPETDQDTAFIIDYLNKIPLFAPLPTISKEHIIDYLNVEKFGPKEVIIQQGKIGTHLYILLKGRVEVVKEDKLGATNVLAVLERGECFGEMSLITGEPCSATIRTQTNVSLLSINKEDFDEMVNTYPSLNIYFNKLLAQRLRSTNVHIEEQLEQGMMGKLNLISLAELTQTIAMNQKTGVLHLTRDDDQGNIFFEKGMIINAQYGDLEREEAFFELLRWNDGSFRFSHEPPEVERVMEWDTMGLLMEGLRRLDEENI
ncbi:MAG: DUF4388 domain-containing protein [Planctomycetota bacterium]|nr:MAG: DUF4388 domain-containing protein [Planctomycetota bacterium]